MPSKNKTSSRPSQKRGPSWQVIVEEIRSENRTTSEAAGAHQEETQLAIQNFRAEVHSEIQDLKTAVRQNSADIRQNSADIKQNSTDIRALQADVGELKSEVGDLKSEVRGLSKKVEGLAGLEDRVVVLEKKG